MKNSDILKCYDGLQSLRAGATQPLSARSSFAIIHNLKTLQPIVEAIQATYNDLVTHNGNQLEDGQFEIKEDCRESFTAQLRELENIETEVSLMKIKFSDIENLNFSLSEMEALYNMMEEGEA